MSDTATAPKSDEPAKPKTYPFVVAEDQTVFVENPDNPKGPGRKAKAGETVYLTKAQANPMIKKGILELKLDEDEAPKKKSGV